MDIVKKIPSAYIFGMRENGLGVARCLGKEGILVTVVSSEQDDPGLLSRYCKKKVILPSIEEEDRWLEWLMEEKNGLETKGVIFPVTDDHILFLSRNREKINPYFRFALPSKEIVETIIYKDTLYQQAEKFNIPYPKSYYPTSFEDAKNISEEINYPCALKPIAKHSWRNEYLPKKLIKVNSPKELLENYLKIQDARQKIIIQEIIAGKDDQLYSFYSYFDKNSNPLVIYTRKKIRQYPTEFGVGSVHMSIWEPRVAELGIKFLKALNYHGIASVEFKKDPKDGEFKLMEINQRTVMPTSLSLASGINIPYIAYQDLIDEKVKKVTKFKEGIKWIGFEDDFKAFLEYRKTGELTLWEWIRSLRGKKVYAYFELFDPLPFIGCVMRKLIKFLAKIIKNKVSSK